MAVHLNVGDVFAVGEVWKSPKGLLWEVIGHEQKPGKRKQAVMRIAQSGPHRPNQRRDWDAVDGWVIDQHAPATNGHTE